MCVCVCVLGGGAQTPPQLTHQRRPSLQRIADKRRRRKEQKAKDEEKAKEAFLRRDSTLNAISEANEENQEQKQSEEPEDHEAKSKDAQNDSESEDSDILDGLDEKEREMFKLWKPPKVRVKDSVLMVHYPDIHDNTAPHVLPAKVYRIDGPTIYYRVDPALDTDKFSSGSVIVKKYAEENCYRCIALHLGRTKEVGGGGVGWWEWGGR